MKYFCILFFLLFSLFSCRSSKIETKSEIKESAQDIDSVSLRVTKTTKKVTTPQATAKLNIDPVALANLPKGAKFENKQGNATATATTLDDGTIEITANCDSLTLLIDELTKEVYRYKESNKALETKLTQKETKGLSGWQNFQIYGFRICMAILAIIFIYKKIKQKWQKNLK